MTFTRRDLLRGASIAGAAAGTLGMSGCAALGLRNLGGQSVLRVATTSARGRDSIDATTGRTIKGLDSILPTFSRKHPDTQVEVIDINAPSSNAVIAKEQTLLMSGDVDVIQGATLWPFYEQGLLANLNREFAADRWASHYIDSIFTPPMERFMYPPWAAHPTTHISAPGDLSAPSVAYDRQLFEDFGVEPLAAVPTIEEIAAKAPRLTGTNPRTGRKCYALYYDPKSTAHVMLYYLGKGIDLGRVDANHPDAIKINTPQMRQGIDGMIKMAQFCPPGFEVGQGAENWGTTTNDVAINMVVYPPDMQTAISNQLADRYTVTEGLRNTAGHTFLVTGTEWAIAASSTAKPAAWDLVKFLAGPAGQRLAFDNSLTLPSWRNADWVDTHRMPYAPAFLAAATAAKNAFFPEFMFTTLRPWIAKVVNLATHGKTIDLHSGLVDMQHKAEQWVIESTRRKPQR